jgi:UDP-N-acetylmuramoyl-tripeptide--D-alanyl-D-alanine ligase
MREKIKNLVVRILAKESRAVLQKHKPKIIAITGNIGKTTTKDFIYATLKSGNVRAAEKSQNSEFGVCLTILGAKNAWNNLFSWMKILTVDFLESYFANFRKEMYPEKIILEIGADHPGDIKHLTSFVKPDLVILTAFQKIPTHGEFFRTIEEHIREKKYLVDALGVGGVIVYNADDLVMSKMARATIGLRDLKLFSFGKDGADVKILGSKNIYNEKNILLGTAVKLSVNKGGGVKEEIEVELLGVAGEAQNYSLAAAVCVGVALGLGLQNIGEAIKNNFAPTNSRMRILRGVNNCTIIDDSYNASPQAVENAAEALKKISTNSKKVVVLGHMAELGDKTKEAHIEQAKNIADVADVIIFSGRYNDFYLEGARQAKFPPEKIFLASNSKEVIEIMNKNNLLGEGNLLFVKGSQSARLEKVVVEFLANKNDAVLVCRQEQEWGRR